MTAFAERLHAVPRRNRTLLVAIDGRGGSGKSTLARALARIVPHATVIEFDDFYRASEERARLRTEGDPEVGFSFDWRRLEAQVLDPLSRDEPAPYQRYDWPADRLADWHDVLVGGTVIVEGNYSTRSELRARYDVTVWVDAPHDLRIARGLVRGGEDTLDRWLEEWLPEEERYLAAEDPRTGVDLVVDGGVELDPATEVAIAEQTSVPRVGGGAG